MKIFILTVIAASLIHPNIASAQPWSIELDASELNPRLHILVDFYTRSLLPHDKQHLLSQDGTRFKMLCQNEEDKYCSIFSKYSNDSVKLDFKSAQKTWMDNYLQTRHERGNDNLITDHLSGFIEKTNYKTWPKVAVDSRVKKTKRVIYRGLFDNRQVSVAETWRDRGEGEIIEETEIAVETKRERRSFDFYVYDINGQIALESEFPAGMRAAPMVCVSCHMSSSTKKTSRFIKFIGSGH